MLEDERMEKHNAAKKKFNVKYLDCDCVFGTMGHAYSILIEEMSIKNPDINAFIDRFNEHVVPYSHGYPHIESASDKLTVKNYHKLEDMMGDMLNSGEVYQRAAMRTLIGVRGFRVDGLKKTLKTYSMR